ncbi:MAG: nucleotidyltransferase domain-containing protein [Actinomycetota bacterium]|nr:nucleotidyltransferase domain-containing protein [Actinomycetota bacterium]MDD5665925.1 nucleotidyltransferase domain-containing protein [Actinomycetota bacterium]
MAKLDIEEIERRKTERKELLQSSLERLLPQLESIGAVKVVVFGSLADGTTHSRSDLDILVVMPQERSGREWSRIIYSEIDRAVASDILVFNTVELTEEVEANVFLQQALEGGRTVFEKDA